MARNILSRLACLAKPALVAAACLVAGNVGAAAPAPYAVRGVLDLRGWDLERDGPVTLAGEWEFAWRRFDDLAAQPDARGSGAQFIAVPGAWPEPHGFATYRLSVLCDDARSLALSMPAVHSAMRLYVNGRVLARQGSPASVADASRPALVRQSVPLGGVACPLRLVLQVSNFHHRQGGLLHAPLLGSEEPLGLMRVRGLALNLMLATGFAITALLAGLFYATRRRDLAPLWLALFCLCLTVYFALSKEAPFAQLAAADAGWEAHLTAQLVSLYLATPLLAVFVRSLYPQWFDARAVSAIAAAGAVAALAALALPARLHSYAQPLMELLAAGTALWCAATLGWIAWRRRSPLAALLVGMALSFPVMALDLLGDDLVARYAFAPVGLLCFVAAPATVLSRRYARALNAEEARLLEERYATDLIGRTTKVGLIEWDARLRRTTYSGRFKEMLGYPVDLDTRSWDFFLFVHEDDREIVRGFFSSQTASRGEPNAVRQHMPWDYRLRRLDGSYIWVHAEPVSVTGREGQTLRYLCSFLDVTESHAVEQALRTERERLRESIALTQAIVTQTPNAIFVKDSAGRFTLANRGWSEMSGIPAEQAIGRTVHELYPPELAQRFAGEDERLIAQGAAAAPIESVHQGPRPGQYRIVRKAVLSNEEGAVLGLVCSSTDISELKRIETELRDQIELTRALIDDNPNAMYLKDTAGRYVRVNDAWLAMVGLEREQALGRTVRELFPEAESERYHAEDMRIIAEGAGASEMESLRTGPGGEPQWVIVRKAVLRNAQGEVVGLVGTNTDITRLKTYEAELAERARFVTELVDAMPISVAVRDTEGRYILVNRAWEGYFGVRREDALGRRRRELPGWPTDPERLADAEEIERLDREILEGGADHVPGPQETLRLGRYYLITRRALFDSGGRPLGVVSAGIDMTERRAMEQRLRDEMELTRALIDENPNAMYLKDAAGRYLKVNDAWVRMLGVPRERALGRTMTEIFDTEPSRDASHAEDLRLLARGEGASEIEVERTGPDGNAQWLIVRKAVLHSADGALRGLIGTNTDVTRLKRYEEELRNRVKFIQDLFDSVPLSLAMRDPQGRFLFVNRTWETYTGTKREDVLGQLVSERLPAAEAEAILAEDRAALARGAGAPIDFTEFPFRGRHLMQTRTVMSDAQARVLGVLVASFDMTERRAIEQQLALEKRRLDLVVRGSRAGIVDWDGHTHATYYSPRFREILGHAPDADISHWPDYFKVLLHPDDRSRFTQRWQAFIKGKGPEGRFGEFLGPDEHRLLRADGTYVWVEVNGIAVRDEKGFVTRWIAATTDISERRKQEELLRESDARYDMALRATNEGVYDWNIAAGTIFYSDNVYRVLGAPASMRTPQDWRERVHPEDRARYDAAIVEHFKGRSERFECEYRYAAADGSWRWARQHGIALRNAEGRAVRMIGATGDITELKRYEHELAERARFVTELVDALPVSIALRDTEGRFVMVNRTWEGYFELTRSQVLGRRFLELPGWKESPELVKVALEADEIDRETLATGSGAEAQARDFRRLDRTYLISRRTFADPSGRLTVLATGFDVTERRAMEQALIHERERLALLLRATKAGFMDWEARSDTRSFSERFKAMLGYPAEADTSAWPSLFDMMHPEDREPMRAAFRDMLRAASASGERMHGPLEYRLRRADGAYIWVRGEGIAQIGADGRAERFLTAYIDITELREMNEALRESVRLREEVERMSRHDLKTPLSSVIAMSRLLREGARVPPEDAELLATIERAGYRILNMVNLSLDLFRMETGTYQFHPQAVDLAEVARRVAADLESQAASKGIDVRVRANGLSAATQEVLARADELLCYSMFANLVKNAIEASPPGGTVSISLRSSDGPILAEVHNPGSVPEAMRRRFFRKYATTGKSAGMGLGTYSARLMARVQEGELALETSEEAGTTLVARFKPAEAGLARATESRAAVGARAEARAALPALKVLVVDDDEFNRLVLRRYLPSPPLGVAFAVNGRAALEAAGRDWPDVVLLDLEMPVMDGYEAARRLRELEGARNLKRALIVAISSNDEDAIVQRALAAGCDHYVVKPAPRDLLWSLLAGSVSSPEKRHEGGEAQARGEDIVFVDADLKDALPEFLRSRRELVDEMPKALAAQDRTRFKRLAHRLAGSFSLYGFHWAGAHARAIEADALAGDAADLAARAAALRAHLDGVTIELKQVTEP